MPSFRHRLLPIAAVLILAIGVSACQPLCREMNDIWIGNAYRRDISRWEEGVYERPVNAWVDNPQMAAFVRNSVQRTSVKWLSIQYGFSCAPKTGEDCPDCFVCTVSRGGVVNVIDGKCQPDGDLFIKAEIGPGTTVRAMTYWRK
jgi:hypothetical protein